MKVLSSILVLSSLLLWGCKGDTGPMGPLPTGTITGTVKLHNAPGNDYSGVTIALEGTPYSATSATDGRWEITDVAAGVYKMVFSKSGYFTQELYNFQFVGKGTYYFYSITLPKVPSEKVTRLDVQVIDSTRTIFFSGSIWPAVQSQKNVTLLLSSSPITRTIPIEAFDLMTCGLSNGQRDYGMYYSPEWYPEVSPGDTLYAIAFLGDEQIIGVSYNPIIGRYIFNTPNVYLSNVVSVIVP